MMTEKRETLPTLWEISDDLWEQIHPVILEMDPPKSTGRKRVDPRRILDGIIFRMRTGCHWNRLPGELGDDSTIHSTFQRWVRLGVLERIWAVLIEECAELGAVEWQWQAADCAMGKARFGGDSVGRNPTDRGKAGRKRSVLVDGSGGPLSVVAGANVHDTKLLAATLESVVVEVPHGGDAAAKHLCLDKGYDNPTGRQAVAAHGYLGHIRRISEEKLDAQGVKRYPARRWVVERTLAWLSKCRAILMRYDKKASNYLGLIQLACALLWYRRRRQLKF